MTGKEAFFDLVNEGRSGHNIGLDIGSPKLMTYMDGFLPGTSYLIGGASGSFKSTYTLYAFIYKPLTSFLKGECPERDPHFLIFNLEMTQPQVYAKLLSMYIFEEYGIQLRFKEMFSRGKDCMLSDDHLELLKACSGFLDILDKRITCVDGSLTEAKFLTSVNAELKKYGSWKGDTFIPNNKNQVLGVLIDHMSLVRASQGRSKKDEMDAISRACVMLRNSTKIMSPILVSQFNRGANSDERLKQSMQDPNASDFKDSAALYEDSQVVLALFSPHKFKMASYRKYNIKELEQCFLGIFLLKSRFGTSDIIVPTFVYGDCSTFAESPKPDEIYDYETYKTPFWLLKNNEQKLDVKQIEDEKENENLKFIL